MGEPSESSVIDYLTLLVEERGPTPGAYLGAELIRAFPSFDLRARGHRSLTGFLDARADRLAVVGRSGVDLVWGLDGAEADDPSSGPSEEHPTRGDGDPSWPEIASAELSIERMVLRNYRSCAETTLELSDITALVGANGTGKSTLLEALYLGCRASAGKPRTIFSRRRDLHRMRTIGRDGPVVVSFEMSHDGSLRFEGTPTSDGGRFEVVARAGAREHTWQYPPPPEQRVPLGTTPPAMACRPVLLLKLRADRLARPSAVQDEQPRVAYDGTGLASVLAHLAATDPERMDR
ncbi:MAG: AAA family ATPase, partial [Nannocystaceae bacterium]